LNGTRIGYGKVRYDGTDSELGSEYV